MDISSLSPEQLVEAINNGADLSSLVQSNSPSDAESCGSESTVLETSNSSSGAPELVRGNGSRATSQPETNNQTNIPDYSAINRTISTGTGALDFDGLDIKDPVELLVLLEEDIRSGDTKLHPWQITFMIDFANSQHTKESPFQAAVQACNSSGKDKYVIAACAVWLCMRHRDAYCPVTSSSGTQLDKQTCMHIKRLCDKANVLFQPYGLSWNTKYRNYICEHVNEFGKPCYSEIVCFATDEAGKAEGFHPVEKGKKMAIFTSETKSIPSEICDAIERCTGFTHRVDASSPGAAAGYFYNICSSGIPRTSITDIKSLDSTQIVLYKITAFDCPHITKSEIDRFAAKQPGGVNSIVFRSSILAEFGSTDELVVIPSDFVWRSVESTKRFANIQWISEIPNQAGLDLSMGGAESVLCIRSGNKLIGMEYANIEETSVQIEWLQDIFRKWKLNNPDSRIRGDYVGIGGPILRILKKDKKWNNIVFVDSRNKASDSKTYKNRGTELFFHVRALFEKKHIIIPYDKVLIEQLCSRHYKCVDAKIYQLLSKQEEKNKGYVSPDRADAFNLCFWGYERTDIAVDEITAPYEENTKQNDRDGYDKSAEAFDLKIWASRGQKTYRPDHIDTSELDRCGLLEEINFHNSRILTNRK